MSTFKNTIYLTTTNSTPVNLLQIVNPTAANTAIRITVAGSDTATPCANRFYADRKWLLSDWGLAVNILNDVTYYDDVNVTVDVDTTGKMYVVGNSLPCSWNIFYEIFSSSTATTVTLL